MPLTIDRVETQLDVAPAGETRGRSASDLLQGSDSELLDRLRPIVLRIIEEELDRLRREHG